MRSLLITVLLAFMVQAAFAGGFKEAPSASGIQSVSEIRNAKDDEEVVLEGHILKQLSAELYLFSDASGTVKVEIDPEVFGDQDVYPEDKVRIWGEVDIEISGKYVDVELLKVLRN